MSDCTVTILRAHTSHAGRLSQIAHAAKSYWGYPAQWIDLWHNQLTITPSFIESNEVWAAQVDGSLLGFYALTLQGRRAKLEHLWVMPVAIKQGIGSALYRHALGRAAVLRADRIEMESDPNAVGFYEKMGAEVVGEVGYTLEGQRRALPLLQHDLPQPVLE